MFRFKFILSIGFLFLLLTACNQTEAPTEEEKVQAIKDVLKQGLDEAVTILGKEDGFLTDESLAITLPDQAQGLVDNIKKIPQGSELLARTLSQINYMAGGTIEVIAPIINSAIDNMPVEEANRILMADDAAATAYLEKVTRKPIQNACEPIILESLDKQIWGDVTTRNTWIALMENYNKLADSGIGRIVKMETVDLVLEEVVTEKILDAIFYLMAREEIKIRKHPTTRISKSVIKSFGWIDESKK